jgi:hypothetical protein
MNKKKREYINNKDLLDLIILFRDEPEDNVIKDELANAFLLLANEIFDWQKIDNLQKEEVVNEAAFVCILKASSCFSPERGSAFPYFTTVIVNYYRQQMRSQNSYNRMIGEFAKEEARKSGCFIQEDNWQGKEAASEQGDN